MSNVPKNVLVLKKNLLHFLEIGGRGGVELNVKIIEGNPSLDLYFDILIFSYFLILDDLLQCLSDFLDYRFFNL